MTVHALYLRIRVERLSDLEERGRLIRIVDDLDLVEKALEDLRGTRWEKRARWILDRLDEEVSGRLQRAEGAQKVGT